jgi:hypothetical protein
MPHSLAAVQAASVDEGMAMVKVNASWLLKIYRCLQPQDGRRLQRAARTAAARRCYGELKQSYADE